MSQIKRKRKTVQITDLDLHKRIKVLAAEKGVTIEEVIRIGVERICKSNKAFTGKSND